MKNRLRTLAAAISNKISLFGAGAKSDGQTVPTVQDKYLNPLYEPSNISADNVSAAMIQDAIREAENGNTRELFRFYRDYILGDEHISGELAKRKLAVLGQPISVLPMDKDNEDDVIAAAVCVRAMADCENWNAGLSALLGSTAIWPVSVCEKLFRPANGDKPVMVKIKVAAPPAKKPAPGEVKEDAPEAPDKVITVPLQYTFKRWSPVNPMLFCYKWAYYGSGVGTGTASSIQMMNLPGQPQYTIDMEVWEPLLKLWPTDNVGRIIYDASHAAYLDPNRHVAHRGHLLTEHKDNWGGPGRAILFWWFLRGLGRDGFARFMERYGSPFPVGKTNAQDPESVALLQRAFNHAAKIWGIVIGQDDTVELTQASVQGGAEGHKMWHDVCNAAITFAITGVRPSDKPAGINAGEENVQDNIREDVRIFDQATLAETLQKQPFARLLKFNGLAGQIKVVWGGLSDDDATKFATLLQTMGSAGYEVTDASLPKVNEKTGIEWQRKAAPSAPAMFPGATGGEKDLETLSVGELIFPRAKNPIDPIIAKRIATLTAAYKGSMAPFRQAILESDSKEECLAKLTKLYANWKPERLNAEMEAALQLCAAAGAVKGTEKS